MTDRVLLPLPGLGTLTLTQEQFDAALVTDAAALPGAAPEPLVDAAEAARQLALPSPRWLEDMTREGVVPHHRFGRYVRYRVSDLAAHARVAGAPAPHERGR